jgi:hypothetical protein
MYGMQRAAGQSNFALVGRSFMYGRRVFPKKAAAKKGIRVRMAAITVEGVNMRGF